LRISMRRLSMPMWQLLCCALSFLRLFYRSRLLDLRSEWFSFLLTFPRRAMNEEP
jgi:hypothetical protein